MWLQCNSYNCFECLYFVLVGAKWGECSMDWMNWISGIQYLLAFLISMLVKKNICIENVSYIKIQYCAHMEHFTDYADISV